MADSTSYLSRHLDLFFKKESVAKHLQQPLCNSWDRSWEFYNLCTSQMSEQSCNLIAYPNTNAYITYKDGRLGVHGFDGDAIAKLLHENEYSGRKLVVHLSVWESVTATENGHSCLLVFDPHTTVQTFYDPCGWIGDQLVNRMQYTSLIEGYEPCVVTCLHERRSLQLQMEQVLGLADQSMCGIICILITIQLAICNTNVQDIVEFWQRVLSSRQMNSMAYNWLLKLITWYQRGFVDASDGVMVPM